jgi:hypothetical protein
MERFGDLLDAIIEPMPLLAARAVVLTAIVTVLTLPLGIWIIRPLGPRLKTSWLDKVIRGPP